MILALSILAGVFLMLAAHRVDTAYNAAKDLEKRVRRIEERLR